MEDEGLGYKIDASLNQLLDFLSLEIHIILEAKIEILYILESWHFIFSAVV